MIIGNVNKPFSVTKYCLLFLVPRGFKILIKSSFCKDFKRLERMFVEIFSLELTSSLNRVFLCKIKSLKIKRDHLSPKKFAE